MPYDDDKKFENFPYYDGPLGFELGSTYTTFRVWAPSAESVTLRLYREGMFVDAEFVEKMDRGENGLFDISVPRNLAGYYYDYLVVTGGKKYATADPYAVSSGANGERSMVLDLPSLFAGKLAACIGRQWEKRVKGRDFYDLAFLLRIGAKVNLTYLENKLRQDGLFKGNHLDIETVKAMLRERFAKIDWQLAYGDVLGFLEPGITLRYFEEAFFSLIAGDLQPA